MWDLGIQGHLGENNNILVVVFHTIKRNRRKKLDEVMAEKVPLAWLVSFAVQAGGVLES